MSIAIRSSEEIAKKWAEVTPGRAAQYSSGVSNPLRPWKENTLAATERHKQAVTQALAENRFAKGVTKSSNADWQSATLEKGSRRWGEGVAGAGDKQAVGFAPYQSVIAGLNLPPRGTAGSPANLERVRAVADALHKKKISG